MLLQSFKKNNTTQKKMLWGIILLFLLTIFLYGYFVNATILNIVERQDAEEEIAAIRSSVGDLESRYGALQSTITYGYAKTLGFAEPKQKVFISQKRLVQGPSITF